MFDIRTNDRTNIMISEINEIIKKSGLEFSDIDILDLENLSKKLQVRKSDPLIPKKLPNLVKLCKVLESFEEHSELIHYPAGLVKLIKIATTYPEIIKQHSSSRNPSIKNNPSFNLIIETSKDSLLFHQFLSRLFVWDWCLDLNFQPSSKTKLVEALVVEHSISNLSLEISKFINELNLDLNEDFLAIVFKVRLRFKNKSSYEKEQYLFDTLSKFIDHLFSRLSEIDSTETSSKKDNTLTASHLNSNDLEDSSVVINLYEIQNKAIQNARKNQQESIDEVEETPYFHFEKLPKDISKKSPRYQNGYVKTAILRTTQQAQFLDNANDKLTDEEANMLISAMLNDASDIATQTLITLCFGAEPNFWYTWKTNKSNQGFWIDLEKGIWCTPIEIEHKPKPLKPSVDKLFKATIDYFEKPIPTELLTRLRKLSVSEFDTLGQAFQKSSEAISVECDKWLNEHNSLGRRISTAKIRNHLYLTIMQLSFDEAAAWHITGQHVHKFNRSTTYTTFPTLELIKSYKSALPEFTFDKHLAESKFIGSNRSIALEELEILQKQVYAKVATTKAIIVTNSTVLTIESLADFHNTLVTYLTLLVLIYGHRPTEDPIARCDDLIDSINALFICDKIIDDNHKTRIGFLPDVVVEQIIEYKAHLIWLENTLFSNQQALLSGAIKSSLDSSEINTPFLFFLEMKEESCSVTSVTSISLKRKLQEINSLWKDIPMNFGRHFIATRLRELNLNPEYIHYQLGHISTGEEPYGSLSFLSPRIVSNILIPKLNKINAELGIELITNLSDLAHIDLKPSKTICDLKQTSDLIGPLKRIHEYKQRSTAESLIVRIIYKKYLEGVTTSGASTELFRILSEQATKELIQKSLHQPHKNLVKLSRLLTAQAKKMGVEFSSPTRILKIGLEPTPFDYENTQLWTKAQLIRDTFQAQLVTIDMNSLSYTQTFAMLFLSLIVHSRFSDTKRFEQIFTAILQKNITFDKGQGYFEVVVRKEQIQRIPFDSITANILLSLLEITPKKTHFKSVYIQLQTIIKNELKLSWQTFIQTMTLDIHLNMPACIAHVATGRTRIASVPNDSFARIISKKRLKPQQKLETNNASEQNDKWTSLIINIGDIESNYNFKEQIKVLKTLAIPLSNHSALTLIEMSKKLENIFTAIVIKNQKIAPITQYVGAWLIIRLNTPGERKEKLSFRTVYGYFWLIASRLVEHLIDADLKNVSEESLIPIYNQIIAEQPQEKQHLTAFQLQHFHKHVCVNLLRIEDIGIADLTYEASDSEPSIDANLIMPWELAESLDAIDKHIPMNHLNVQFKLLLTIFHRFGPRVSELVNIEPNDVINENNFKGSISIRWNRLDRIKNPQSFRNILFKEKFFSNEFGYLNEFISIHSKPLHNQAPKGFWVYDFKSLTHEPSYFRQTVSKLIESITGDSNVSNRSFRHSATSLELMRFCAHILNFENIENNLIEKMELESFYPNGFESFLNRVFGHKLPSRRYAYRTGRQQGHSTAKTTLTNYAHFYEFAMPYYFINNYGNHSNGLYKNLTVKTSEALKNLRKRNKNPLELGKKIVHQRVRKQFPEKILSHRITEVTTTIKASPVDFKTPSYFPSPKLIYEAMLYLKNTKDSNPIILKHRYLIDESMFSLLEDAYYRLYEKTAFNPFNFNMSIANMSGFMTYSYNAESTKMEKLIDQFNLLNDSDSISLTPLLEFWINYLQTGKKAWYFELRNQNIEFIKQLQAIGIPSNRIKLSTIDKALNKTTSDINGIKYRYAKGEVSHPIPRILSPAHSSKPSSGILVINENDSRFLNSELNLIFSIMYLHQAICNGN